MAAARAAGQASGVAHMGAHALGAAAYAARAAALAAPYHEAARRDEVRWQVGHMTEEVRAALLRLPALGENSAGPLGPGLLASGVLATTIIEIQAEVSRGEVPVRAQAAGMTRHHESDLGPTINL